MSDPQATPSPLRKALSKVGYLSAIGLLVFIVGVILYSVYAIFATVNY